MAHSLLVVPVPEVEFVVRPRLGRRAPEYLSAQPGDTHAHITLLAPFVDLDALDEGLLSELRSFFGDVVPFTFSLTGVSTFPGGVTYLAPDPSAPFRQLTAALAQRFPEFPPYEGRFADVVPHLTVPTQPGEDLAAVESELAPHLPVAVHAQEAALCWWAPEKSHTVASFGFGTTAA